MSGPAEPSELQQRLRDYEARRQERVAAEAAPVSVVIPGFGEDGKPRRVIMTYAEATMLEFELQTVLTRYRLRSTLQDGKETT